MTDKCCSPATCTQGECDAWAHAMKALGHPVRMRIVMWLLANECGCCGDVCASLPLAQSTVSQHLDMLRRAGIVSLSQQGTRSNYSLNRQVLAELSAVLAGLSANPDLKVQS